MTFPQFILDKIQPLIDSFDKDLKSKLDSIDKELSPRGLINSGVQIKRYESEFLSSLSELVIKIMEIFLNDLKNKQLSKPEFLTVRNDIAQLINPLVGSFRVNFETKIRQLIPKEESATSVLANFDSDLRAHLDKQFVVLEQDFDAIQ